MKLIKKYVALFLTFIIMFSTAQPIMAEQQPDFPLIAANGDLVAYENTKYITLFEQNPDTKLITATVQVQNGTTGASAETLVLNGIGMEISFSDKVAPYQYNAAVTDFDPSRLYIGAATDSTNDPLGNVFDKYCSAVLPKFSLFGAYIVQNDNNNRMISTYVSAVSPGTQLYIAPGETADILKVYFMPVNGTDELDIEMFNYEYMETVAAVFRYSTWIGNGKRLLTSNNNLPMNSDIFIVSPSSFKLHVKHLEPVVSADNALRVVTGYDSDTMEWSDSPNGTYTSDEPVVAYEGQTLYVRAKGDNAYTGNDVEYGNYMKYVSSNPVEVVFDGTVLDQSEKPSIDSVTEGDDKVTGTGVPGAEIEVEFSDGSTVTVTVDGEGNWEANAPTDLNADDEVIAVQKESGKEASEPETAIVNAKITTGGVISIEKASSNLSSTDGKTRVGDILEYAITVENIGDLDSILTDAVVTDNMPNGVTFVTGSVRINTLPADSSANYDSDGKILEVSLGNIATGEPKVITFRATVNGDAYGLNIKNGATVSANDGDSSNELVDTTEEPNGGRDVETPYNIYAEKSSANLTSTDDKTYVGDTIEYTIAVRNNGRMASPQENENENEDEDEDAVIEVPEDDGDSAPEPTPEEPTSDGSAPGPAPDNGNDSYDDTYSDNGDNGFEYDMYSDNGDNGFEYDMYSDNGDDGFVYDTYSDVVGNSQAASLWSNMTVADTLPDYACYTISNITGIIR